MQQACQRPAFYLGCRGDRLSIDRFAILIDMHRGCVELASLQDLCGLVRVFRVIEERDDGVFHNYSPFNS
jgi:hypothetical protein